jgi:leader peptidase (prepilin peptidase)/N-methyltransferase
LSALLQSGPQGMFTELIALMADSPELFAGGAFVLGLVVGSFLNVVIYRLPIMLEREWRAQADELLAPAADAASEKLEKFNLSVPRSACPRCQAPISALQNIPLISWLLLRRRCASCQAPISARYPLVELTTGVLSGWVAWHFGVGVPAACGLLMTWALIALSGIDIDHQLLPDAITLPLMWAGLMAAVIFGPIASSPLPVAPPDALLGAACGYISLWLVFHVFRLITGKEGMGYGDFKLFAALGAWLGWKLLPLVILLSAGSGAIFGIAIIVLRGRDRSVPMPFGPYLAAAGWLGMMYGNSLLDSYLRIAGLRH